MPRRSLSVALTSFVLLLPAVPAPAGAPVARQTKVPRWDAAGLSLPPWQGIACLDVNDDATRIALGTIAPAGDPNVLLLDGNGKLLRQQRAGQRWINQVALGADAVIRAVCTMPAGRAADMPEVFRLGNADLTAEAIDWRRGEYADGYFHYGDHSNHVTRLLTRAGPTAVDVVLPGHGAVGGPADTLRAGVEVAVAGGWGLFKPEKPDPYFRIAQKNVVVAAWNIGATSAAFGDIDGDGKPDVAVVSRQGNGSLVRIFLNKGGKFNEVPDETIKVPGVSNAHKIRVIPGSIGEKHDIFVAGTQSAAWLVAPDHLVFSVDVGDGNWAGSIDTSDGGGLAVARRFGGLQFVDIDKKGERSLFFKPFKPEINGPYVDARSVNLHGDERRSSLVTSRGQIFLRDKHGKLPEKPSLQLETERDDWTFLGIGDFDGDGKPDIALLAYGMNKQTSARIFYHTGDKEKPFHEKPDAVIPLNPEKKGDPLTLVRDAPVVCDWNGDGVDDLVIGRGQSQEVLVLLGGRDGLDAKRSERIALDYRVHYETGLFVGDFNGDGRPDLAVFGYTLTGIGWGGPPAAYIWLQPPRRKSVKK